MKTFYYIISGLIIIIGGALTLMFAEGIEYSPSESEILLARITGSIYLALGVLSLFINPRVKYYKKIEYIVTIGLVLFFFKNLLTGALGPFLNSKFFENISFSLIPLVWLTMLLLTYLVIPFASLTILIKKIINDLKLLKS